MAVLLITHDLGVVAGHADRVSSCTPAGSSSPAARPMFSRPRHRYTEALLRSLPPLAARAATRPCTVSPAARPHRPAAGLPVRTALLDTRWPAATPRCPYWRATAGSHCPAATATPASSPAPGRPARADLEGRLAAGAAAGRSGAAGALAPVTPIPADDRPRAARGDRPREGLPGPRSGVIVQRKVGAVSAVAGVSLRLQRGDGRSASLASRAAARQRWAASSSASTEPTSGRVLFRGAGWTGCGVRTGAPSNAATSSSCSRTRTRPLTRGCGSARSCGSHWRSSTSAPPATGDRRRGRAA